MAPFVCICALLIKLYIKVWHFSSSTDVGDSIFCWGNWLKLHRRCEVCHDFLVGRLPVWNMSWVIPQCPPSVPEILEVVAIIYRFTKNKGPYFLLGQVGIDPQNHFLPKVSKEVNPTGEFSKDNSATCANRYIQATVLAFAYFSYPQRGERFIHMWMDMLNIRKLTCPLKRDRFERNALFPLINFEVFTERDLGIYLAAQPQNNQHWTVSDTATREKGNNSILVSVPQKIFPNGTLLTVSSSAIQRSYTREFTPEKWWQREPHSLPPKKKQTQRLEDLFEIRYFSCSNLVNI